mgnify:CR=1 FL=1
MAEVKFEIINHIGVLSTSKSGWTKELNVVSWNGGPPKYDIREWNEDHTKMSKGITMNEEEIGQLRLLFIN